MNQYEIDGCVKILTSMLSVPVSKLFTSVSNYSDLANPMNVLTLDHIMEKTQRALYHSTQEWVTDVRLFFSTHYSEEDPSSIRFASLKLLESTFERLLSEFNPSLLPACQSIRQILANYDDWTKFVDPEILVTPSPQPSRAKILNLNNSAISSESLVRLIRVIKDTDVLLQSAAILYKIRPESVYIVDSQVTLMPKYLKPAEIEKAYRLIRAEAIRKIKLT